MELLPWEKPAPPEPEMSPLRRYLAMGARGAGALIGTTPGVGALGGGGGEALAEFIENKGYHPGRIAAETAIGAAGGGIASGVVKYAGRPAMAALRGALLGATQPVAKSVLEEGELPEAKDVAIGAGVGGVTAGALSKLFGMMGGKAPKAAEDFVVEPTNRSQSIRPIPSSGADIKPAYGPAPPPSNSRVPLTGTPAEASGRVQKVVAKETAAEEKATQAEIAKQQFEDAKVGLSPKKPSVSESYSTDIPGGKGRVNIGYGKRGAKTKVAIADTLPTTTPAVPETVPSMVEELKKVLGQPTRTGTTSDVSALPFYKTKSGAAGKNYRLAKDAETAGEIPSAQYARDARLREITPKPATEPVPTETSTEAPQEDWVQRQNGLIDNLRNLGKSESGGINPRLLASLGLGATGAAVGASTDEENPLRGAAIGGAAGASLPHLPKLIEHIQGLKTPEGAKEWTTQVMHYLPRYYRSNLLLSSGLPANIVAGPIGSAYYGALEHAMGGGEHAEAGKRFLQTFNPAEFAKRFPAALKEAGSLIGRAERAGGEMMGEVESQADRLLSIPGQAMTAGDVIVRNALTEAGFPEEIARKMTLTSDPEWRVMKKIVDVSRHGGPVGQMLLPFSRTTANMFERAAERFPGVGTLVNAFKEHPDPTRLQAIQQALGAGTMVGAEQAGENLDPDDPTTKQLRKLLTNAAGPNSLLASAAFSTGQARQLGHKAPFITGAKQAIGGLPLPTAEPATRILDYLGSDNPEIGIPSGAYPTAFKEFYDLLNPPNVKSRRAAGATKATKAR